MKLLETRDALCARHMTTSMFSRKRKTSGAYTSIILTQRTVVNSFTK